MNAARWILVGVLAGGSVGFFLGAVLGTTAAAHRWQAHLDEAEDELRQASDDLDRADATIDMLRRNDGVAFMAGQMLRADMEQWGVTDE